MRFPVPSGELSSTKSISRRGSCASTRSTSVYTLALSLYVGVMTRARLGIGGGRAAIRDEAGCSEEEREGQRGECSAAARMVRRGVER